MNQDLLQTLIRSVAKIGAGYFAAKGIGDDSTWEIVIAGIVGLGSIIWGALHRAPSNTEVK